jgi:uncharacterized membrane protein YfhO
MSTSDRPENTAMISGYYGISYWLSIMNNYTQMASDTLIGYEQEWRSDGFSHVGEYETALGGVKYYFSKGEYGIPEGYEAVESFDYYGEKWTVYENTRWFGLAYTRDPSAGGLLSDENRGAAPLSPDEYKAYFAKMCEAGALSPAQNVVWDNKKGILKFTTADNGNDEAVIMLPYSKGFSAYIDGQPADTFVDDLMCTALSTGGGSHEIELRYRNPMIKTALILTFAAIVLLSFLFYLSGDPSRHGGRLVMKE